MSTVTNTSTVRWPASPVNAARFIIGFAAVFALFQWLGTVLGSDRGQAGVVIGAAIVAATLAFERWLSGAPLLTALRRLGLGWPARRGIACALAVCFALVVVVPAYFTNAGATIKTYPGWLILLPGLFAQAGIAEEVLFRGYLFRRLRVGRSFWRAAFAASLPFVLVHLWLFMTLPWPLAVASVMLSALMSFPLAHLFELGGKTIWAPALLHWLVQGVPKVLDLEGDTGFALWWIAASAVVPFIAFAWRRKDDVIVRPATVSDVPALNALIEESARVLSRGFYTDKQSEAAIRYVFGVDTTLVSDGTYFVVERDGDLAGCGGWSRRRTLYGGDQRPVGEQDVLDPVQDAARIRAFFVSPRHARQGVGRRLLHACQDAAAAAGFTSLELMATLPGVPFYSALGFTSIERVVDMLPDGTPLPFVRMEKYLR